MDVSPGPLIHTLSALLGKDTPASLRHESVVPFRMVDGRVYHENLELMFPDFTIRTSGWVGTDQRMQIMAEMPVPPKWLENNPLASTLRNQTIRVPVAGTLSKPDLDKQAMEQLTRQFVHKAAENLLQNEVSQQLDRLFAPKK
jgi:translocation and assembly module TamB